MFNLAKQNAKVAHINIREEKHGEENVLAADLNITASVPNTFLEGLSPGLRASLYDNEKDGLDLDPENPHTVVLRYPQMSSFVWAGEMAKALFTVHGAKKADDLGFTADINKLRLTPKDGGTVDIQFRVQIQPQPEDIGDITTYLGQNVKVSVKPSEMPDSPPIEG